MEFLFGIVILLIVIGGLLVWPMIARLIEAIHQEESYGIPLIYLMIYTELLIVYFVFIKL